LWGDSRIEDYDLFPLGVNDEAWGRGEDDGNRVTFAEWYLDWLDETEAEARSQERG
jgi:hypothetical protein